MVHVVDAEIVNCVVLEGHAKTSVEKSVTEIVVHTLISPRLPAVPIKSAIGVPGNVTGAGKGMPWRGAKKTPVPAVTDVTAIAAPPVPST